MNTLIGWVARIAVGKQIIESLAWVHNKLDGHRSEISLGILALVHGLKLAGVIPAATAGPIESALSAILPVVLADKASKVIALADKVIPATAPAEAPANDPVESAKA